MFLQPGRILFRILQRQSGYFSSFCIVFSLIAFRNRIVPFPKSQAGHPGRARAPLRLPHMFFDVTNFYKILPLPRFPITKSRYNTSGISSQHAVFVQRLGTSFVEEKQRTREWVCKVLYCRKTYFLTLWNAYFFVVLFRVFSIRGLHCFRI